MFGEGETEVPQSPETQPADVRADLEQTEVSHNGPARSGDQAGSSTGDHFGAVDSETTPIMPPVRGPADLVTGDEPGDDIVDPADEITPG